MTKDGTIFHASVGIALLFSTWIVLGAPCTDTRAVSTTTDNMDEAAVIAAEKKLDGFFIGANGCMYNPGLVSTDTIIPVGAEHLSDPEQVVYVIPGGNVG